MAKAINQVMLMGNLTRDPEQRETKSGKSVVNFTLAVNDGDEASFFDVTAWEKTGELVSKYLKKGSRCIVQGRLHTNKWEQDGQKRQRVEVVAFDVTFLSPKQSDENLEAGEVSPEEIDDKPIDLSEIPL